MNILKILGTSGVVAFGATLFLFDMGYACACKRKTTGYFQQMGRVETTAVRMVDKKGLVRSLTGVSGDPTLGRKIIIDRKRGNCLACHRISVLKDQPFHGDIGPTLNRVALRYTEPQLRQMMVDARKYFPKTIMPPFYTTQGMNRVNPKFSDKTILTAQEIENVLAFLKTLN